MQTKPSRSQRVASLAVAIAALCAVASAQATNLAPNGTASQSSLYCCGGGFAERAIDGNTDGYWSGASVTHTDDLASSWWQVELGGSFTLERVLLYNRSDGCCVLRLSNFRLSVYEGTNEVWGADYFVGTGSVDAFIPLDVALPAGTEGDRVRVEINGSNNNGDNFLSLAEVEVMGFFGSPYCLAVANSTGSPATILAGGSPSVTANSLGLVAEPVPSGEWGVFFYGDQQGLTAFGNGFRCIHQGGGAMLYRMQPVVSVNAGNQLVLAADIGSPPHGSGLITAGSTWHFQAWYADTGAGGAGFNLTNGLTIQFQN